MPPKTLTAEQVAEIDRQQKPAVNMRDVVPQREDVLAARITAQERREAAPATLTPEQADATEAQASVAAMTPFGRAMGAEPDRTTGPVFQPKKRLSAAEADQMQYEQISSPAYMPTKGEFQWYEGYRKTRDDKVSKFVQGATGMAGGLVQAAAATAYAPFDLLVRGTPAWNEWVNSSAEGLRQTSIGLAELWSWGGDIYEDNQKELQRSRDLNNQIRQQLAAENKFTGNAQQDDQILEQAINQAKAGGLYEKTADDLNADEDTRFERFIRDRSFQQQAANITETNIGTLPDSQREMGIDPSKVNPGLAFTAQLVFDPLNAVVPGGIGALSNLRLMRRTAALAGAPLKWSSQVAKASADKVEDLYGGILSGIESRTGLNEAAAMGALNNPVTWRAVAAMGILKGTGKVLRKSENWLETGSIIAKEAGVGGVGISRADAAARLRNAPIPERYRRAYDGFFTSADSTLRRVSETPGLSPIARRSAATLDRTGVTQAFRLADDAVSGAAAATPIGIPFAAIAPEDRQPEILGAILSIGAAGGVVGGQARRMSQMSDALVAKMLADAEISGGDAVAMANMLSPEKLADMARKQTMISAKADWVPLRAVDYELNKTVQEAVGNGTKGIHVEATPGKRPRVFLNLDKLASGDVAGHEIGHAIFMSDIMGGEIKQGMRAMVDVEYGAEGLAARGREYAAAMLTQEVNQGATGIKLEVLTPEEVNRKAAGVSEADLIRDRWSNDSAWRDSAINDRIDLMNQERMARGGQPLDWARDEIAAETFSGLGKGVNLNGLRASGPLGRAVGAAQTALDMMGARFRGNGRLESPNKLFTENPLFDSPQMRKAVNDYVKIYDRYLVGLEKEGKVQQRGTPIAPTGRASDAARSPHTRLYPNKGVVESDLFVQRPDGTLELKSQQMINTQDKARAATLKSINSRDRLVPENSQEWGARRLSNGRVVVGGPTLPPQFDFFLQMPEWLRFKAREFEAGRNEGRSYLYSYNAIGTGADGSYKVKNLGNVEAKTGEAVPFGWDLSQKNHLLAKVIDLNSFRASSMRAIDNQLLGEFGNDLKAVEAGLKQLLKNYQDGVPGETNLGVTKKNILNGLLGTGTPTQRANNPAWHTLNNQGSIRTFRFDRLNYADPYGTGYFPHYDKLNINALPDDAGRMSVDDYMGFDADRQTAWLNNRARERGHSNSTNWANSDEAGFAAAAEEYRQLFPRADAPMARGNAMPDVAVVPERFTGTGQEPNRQSRFAQPPPFFARFPVESYERGGKFFDAQSGEDLTGRSYGAGFIDVSSGKPRLFVDGGPAAQPAKSGRIYRTNLFKQKAGWKWTSDNAPATSTIVSVEGGGRHVYALRADFEGGVDLARYSDKPSEPRLRPTARGELSLGNEVGRISIRGKEHPVYDGARIVQPAAARGQAMPDSARPERADIPLNPRARQAAFISDRGEVRATGRATHFETNEDLGPDFLAIGAGHLGEDGFFRFGSQSMDEAMGESPATSSAAAARYNQSVYDQGKRPSAMLEEPPGLERPTARGQAMPDVGDAEAVGLRSAKFLEEAVGDGMENLRAKQAKREGTGVAKNKFVRFHDNQGRPIYIGAIKKDGGKSFAGWIEETEAWQSPAETAAYRQWYRELKGYFTKIFGDRAGEMMMAWLAAQQNVSPGGALGNVFKVEDRLAGIGTGKKGGLADAKIEGVLRSEVPEGGFGPKLTDFVDAGFLREYRTYMAKQPAGGRPFVADVHTGRDSGHVDQQTLTRLKQRSDEGDLFIDGKPTRVKVLDTKTVKQGSKTVIVPERIRVIPQGSKGFDVGVDMRGSPGGPKYEGISEWGNAMTDHLNNIGWRDGEWTPAEVQAVGWMRVLRQYGLPEPTVLSALQQNTSRVFAEVNYSSGNLLPANYPSFDTLSPDVQRAITTDVITQTVNELAPLIGGSLRVQRVTAGTGVWGNTRSPTTVVEVLGSAEATDIFGLALATASEQAATMSTVLGVGGKDSRVLMFKKAGGAKFSEAEMQSLIDDAGVSGYTLQQLPDGDTGIIADSTKDFKPKGFTEKKIADVKKKLVDWAEKSGVDIDVEIASARVNSYANNWNNAKDGQSYLSGIVQRGGSSKIRDIVRFRGRYAEILREAYERHAPEAVVATPQEQIGPIRQAAEAPPLEILEMLRGA
jgi:hypothetical protein